jgi:hypothetical protein
MGSPAVPDDTGETVTKNKPNSRCVQVRTVVETAGRLKGPRIQEAGHLGIGFDVGSFREAPNSAGSCKVFSHRQVIPTRITSTVNGGTSPGRSPLVLPAGLGTLLGLLLG